MHRAKQGVFTLRLLIAILAFISLPAQAQDIYRAAMNEASAAFKSEDWDTLNSSLDTAQAARPWSLYVYRNRILARMLAGREADALALAEKAAARGLSLNLAGHPAFDRLKAIPEFASIAARMEKNLQPVGDATVLFDDGPADLLPEALAFDANGAAYIGSVRTGVIMKRTDDGEFSNIEYKPVGGIFDLEIRGEKIWAAVNNQLAYRGPGVEEPFAAVMRIKGEYASAVIKFGVSDDISLFGDIEVDRKGTIYASDSLTPHIFRDTNGDAGFNIFASDPRFVNLQGIALDEKKKRLFIADYLAGLFVVDLKTGAVTQLQNQADAHLGGIDGLYYYNGGLIGIQNGTTPQRIVQIELDRNATRVTRFTTLQANLVGWNEPTHGAVYEDVFYYIATSNWPAYDDEGALREGAELKPLTIMSLPLESF